jgi:cytochrome c oxidase subunit 4
MATEHNHHDNVGHVVPLPLLGAVIAALMVLTWLTVFVTRFDLGSLNIFVALAIAVIKGALVVLFFMHLRWDAPINGIVLISSLLLVFLFIGFALMDSAAYAPDQISGYAPLINP